MYMVDVRTFNPIDDQQNVLITSCSCYCISMFFGGLLGKTAATSIIRVWSSSYSDFSEITRTMRPKPTITWTSSSWFEQSLILGHCIPFQKHSKINSEFCREIMLDFYFLLDTQTNFVLEQKAPRNRTIFMLPCSHWRRPPWHLLDTAKTVFQCLGMVGVSQISGVWVCQYSPLDELYPQNFMVLAPFCNIHLYLPMLSNTNDTWLISSSPH